MGQDGDLAERDPGIAGRDAVVLEHREAVGTERPGAGGGEEAVEEDAAAERHPVDAGPVAQPVQHGADHVDHPLLEPRGDELRAGARQDVRRDVADHGRRIHDRVPPSASTAKR